MTMVYRTDLHIRYTMYTSLCVTSLSLNPHSLGSELCLAILLYYVAHSACLDLLTRHVKLTLTPTATLNRDATTIQLRSRICPT